MKFELTPHSIGKRVQNSIGEIGFVTIHRRVTLNPDVTLDKYDILFEGQSFVKSYFSNGDSDKCYSSSYKIIKHID